MYSLRVLFFSLPLYFSHVLGPFGIAIGESYSFERYKIYLFLILLVISYTEVMIRYPHHIFDIFRKYILYIIIFLAIPTASALYFAIPLDLDWFMGSHEKHHGYLFYAGVISLILLLMASSREHLRSYLIWSGIAAGLIALIAVGEYIGGVGDIYHRGEMLSAYTGRSVSTLGNPNYVAGYLLLFVPLLMASSLLAIGKMKQRIDIQIVHILTILILLIAIYVTGSYIAMVLIGLLGLWYVLQYMFPDLARSRQIIIWIMLSICLVFIALSLIDLTKLLSLSSRFVLMRESLSMMVGDPISFLIGFGPDSILTYFAQDRSILINSYFPANMSIDSSHNVFIDILFQYGIFPILIIGYALITTWKNQKKDLQIAILLGGVFLTLNVFVVAHIVVLCLLILISMRESNH